MGCFSFKSYREISPTSVATLGPCAQRLPLQRRLHDGVILRIVLRMGGYFSRKALAVATHTMAHIVFL